MKHCIKHSKLLFNEIEYCVISLISVQVELNGTMYILKFTSMSLCMWSIFAEIIL